MRMQGWSVTDALPVFFAVLRSIYMCVHVVLCPMLRYMLWQKNRMFSGVRMLAEYPFFRGDLFALVDLCRGFDYFFCVCCPLVQSFRWNVT